MNEASLDSFHYTSLLQGFKPDESASNESSKKLNLPSPHTEDEIRLCSLIDGLSSISSRKGNPDLQLCKKHSMAIGHVCETCREKICAECLNVENHKSANHTIKHLVSLKESADSEIKRYETLLLDMSITSRETENNIEEKRKAMVDMIQNKFTEIQATLDTKKAQLIEKINLLHDQETARVRKETGEDSLTRQVIARRINAYQQILQIENPFELIEDPLNLFKTIQAAVQPEKIDRIDQKLQVLYQNIESILTNQLSALQQIQVKIPRNLVNEDIGLDDKASLIEELVKYNNHLKKNQSYLLCTGESSIIIDKKDKQKLKISYPFHVCNNHNLNSTIQDLGKDISILKFKISRNIEKLSQEDVSFLLCLRTKLPNIQEIHIHIWDHQISDDTLQAIFSCLFWENESLTGIFFKCYKKEGLFEKSILYLAEKVLSTSKNLQKFAFYFEHCQITNKACDSLNHALSQLAQNLTYLYFICACQDVDAISLQKLFVPMPNLKFFLYQTFSQAFGDEILESFITQTLPSFNSLSDFQLFLPNSQATDTSVRKLFNSFPQAWFLTGSQLRQLNVSFGNTKISEEILRVIAHETVPNLKGIEEFSLDCDFSLVTGNMKEKIKRWRKILSGKIYIK